MVDATLNQANKVTLALKMSQFFGRDVWAAYHFDGDRTKIAKDFLARWGREDLRYVLADLPVSIGSSYTAIYSDINPVGLVGHPASLTVAALTAAPLQLFVYAGLRHGSSSLAHQTSWQDEQPSFRHQ